MPRRKKPYDPTAPIGPWDPERDEHPRDRPSRRRNHNAPMPPWDEKRDGKKR